MRTLAWLVLALTLQGCAKPETSPVAMPAPRPGCNSTPACRAYLDTIRNSVYEHWNPDENVAAGGVQVSFRIDVTGRFKDILIVRSDSDALAASCLSAMQAVDAPDVPESVVPLLDRRIVASFDFSRGKSP